MSEHQSGITRIRFIHSSNQLPGSSKVFVVLFLVAWPFFESRDVQTVPTNSIHKGFFTIPLPKDFFTIPVRQRTLYHSSLKGLLYYSSPTFLESPTPNPPTNIVDFRGFDSSTILI